MTDPLLELLLLYQDCQHGTLPLVEAFRKHCDSQQIFGRRVKATLVEQEIPRNTDSFLTRFREAVQSQKFEYFVTLLTDDRQYASERGNAPLEALYIIGLVGDHELVIVSVGPEGIGPDKTWAILPHEHVRAGALDSENLQNLAESIFDKVKTCIELRKKSSVPTH